MAETKKTLRPQHLAGKRLRLTQDNPTQGLAGPLASYAAPDQENNWRSWELDSRTLDRIAPADLIELLCDLSPDVSRALWDFLRMCNPGYTVKALRPGSETIDKPAQAAVDAFLEVLKGYYGDPNVVIDRLFIAAFVRGAYLAEVVLDRTGRMPVDLVTPDPRWVYWSQRDDPQRGKVWVPFQWQNGQRVSLDVPTVRYVPVDPLPGKPYGRSPASPALFTVLFALGLLHDLRRVVSQQGYPRIDISINLEELIKVAPQDVKDSWEEFDSWVGQIENQIKKTYEELEPDDAYVHTSIVEVNRPVGTVDASSLSAVGDLFEILERWAIRALKSTPLMFGAPDGASEANANRQWEIHAAGIAALQHRAECLWEYLLEVGLRAQGIQASVEFRFATLRASEELRDEQTRQLKIANSQAEYQAGFTSQDQACEKATGQKKADQEKPRGPIAPPKGGSQNPLEAQPEPGVNRQAELLAQLRANVRARRLEAERFNPNHDPHTGEFTGGAGGEGTHVHQSREYGPIPMHAASDEERKEHKIPPAYSNAYVADHADSPVLWKATTPAGKFKQQPSPAHEERAAIAKFERVRELDGKLPAMRQAWDAEIASGGKNKDQALVLRLISRTGFRNGGETRDTFGASTLRSEHATVDGDRIHFDFPGKGGVRQRHSVTDPVLARHIEARQAAGEERLFKTTDTQTLAYLKKSSGEDFKVHDLRTRHATATAAVVMARIDARGQTPKTVAELATQTKRAVKIAARRIGDTESVARERYVDPKVFTRWQTGVE